MTEREFDAILNRGVDAITERLFKPDKYPDFHAYLDALHERWIAKMKGQPASASSACGS